MLDLLLWFISQFDYTVCSEIKLNFSNEVDSLHVNTMICEDRPLPNVKVMMNIDYNILGKKIYFTRYDKPTDIKSGICTQINISDEVYFRINGTFYSMSRYLISDSKDHLMKDIELISKSGVGVSYDTRLPYVFNGILKSYGLNGFKYSSTAACIYMKGSVIPISKLSGNQVTKLYRLEKITGNYVNISKDIKYEDYGEFRVTSIQLFPNNIIIVSDVKHGDLLLGVNFIPDNN